MAHIRYVDVNMGAARLEVVRQANGIIEAYQAQGYRLTLRQLYYRFVAADLIPNTMRSYKRLGDIVNQGRLGGLIDWQAIEDRTRAMEEHGHWSEASSIVRSAARSFRLDTWEDQPVYVEVWVEKEALAAVVERAAGALDVPWFSCRGYVSQSSMWEAAERIIERAHPPGLIHKAREAVVFHLGDHDPSGLDRTRPR